MGLLEAIADLLLDLVAPARKGRGRTPREPWSVRRSRKRMQRTTRHPRSDSPGRRHRPRRESTGEGGDETHEPRT
jgi:hypothetical protein